MDTTQTRKKVRFRLRSTITPEEYRRRQMPVKIIWLTLRKPAAAPDNQVGYMKLVMYPERQQHTLGIDREGHVVPASGGKHWYDVYVALVKVYPLYRGRGYASLMLGMATRWMDENGLEARLMAVPFDKNISIIDLTRFYNSVGFEPANRVKKADILSFMFRSPAMPALVTTAPARAVAALSLDRSMALAAAAGL